MWRWATYCPAAVNSGLTEKIYTVSAGDLLVFNPRVMHEGIVTDPENPSVEFFVAFTNVTFCGAEANHFPLPDPGCSDHTHGNIFAAAVK